MWFFLLEKYSATSEHGIQLPVSDGVGMRGHAAAHKLGAKRNSRKKTETAKGGCFATAERDGPYRWRFTSPFLLRR